MEISRKKIKMMSTGKETSTIKNGVVSILILEINNNHFGGLEAEIKIRSLHFQIQTYLVIQIH
jgi:hypothetical protein